MTDPLKLTRNILLPRVPDTSNKDELEKWMTDLTKILNKALNDIYDDLAYYNVVED